MYNPHDNLENAKFEFYEVVEIIKVPHSSSEKIGEKGIVLAKGRGNDGKWGYTLSTENYAIDMLGENLQSTGKFVKREDIYSGESVKVAVDEQGRGYAKDHPDAALLDDDEME